MNFTRLVLYSFAAFSNFVLSSAVAPTHVGPSLSWGKHGVQQEGSIGRANETRRKIKRIKSSRLKGTNQPEELQHWEDADDESSTVYESVSGPQVMRTTRVQRHHAKAKVSILAVAQRKRNRKRRRLSTDSLNTTCRQEVSPGVRPRGLPIPRRRPRRRKPAGSHKKVPVLNASSTKAMKFASRSDAFRLDGVSIPSVSSFGIAASLTNGPSLDKNYRAESSDIVTRFLSSQRQLGKSLEASATTFLEDLVFVASVDSTSVPGQLSIDHHFDGSGSATTKVAVEKLVTITSKLISDPLLLPQVLQNFEGNVGIGSGKDVLSEEALAADATLSSASARQSVQITPAPITLDQASGGYEGIALEETQQKILILQVVHSTSGSVPELLSITTKEPFGLLKVEQAKVIVSLLNLLQFDGLDPASCGLSTSEVSERATSLTLYDSQDMDTTSSPALDKSTLFRPKTVVSYNDVETSSDDESDLTVSVVTWNLAEESPTEADAAFLRQFRKSRSRSRIGSDLVLVSGQECENIKLRRTEGHRSREFRRLIIKMLGKQYVPVAMHQLGGIQFALFCRREVISDLEHVSVADVTCGIGNVFHNKGAIGAFVKIKARNPLGTGRAQSLRMLFITAHMAAHVKNFRARDSDFWRIVTELESQAPDDFLTHIKQPERGCNLIESLDRVFFCGDLNYRADLPREMVEYQLAQLDNLDQLESEKKAREIRLNLLRHDQLLSTISEQRAFPGLTEGEITFRPTFKFDKRANEYDTSPKQRVPSWTDRVLFKPHGVRVVKYESVAGAMHSDHRPVFGSFRVSRRGRRLP